MTLIEFRTLLTEHPAHAFQLRLPGGEAVPECFHITEVARIHKTFIDCGGTLRETETCQLQAWLGTDEDHRLATGKMSGILASAAAFLLNDGIPLEIEYETNVLTQYSVGGVLVSDAAVVMHLEFKHTDCLAKEVCCPPKPSDCGCAPGCC